jgi:hypothetical protein
MEEKPKNKKLLCRTLIRLIKEENKAQMEYLHYANSGIESFYEISTDEKDHKRKITEMAKKQGCIR